MKKVTYFFNFFVVVAVFFSFSLAGCATGSGDLNRVKADPSATDLEKRMAALEARPTAPNLSTSVSNLQKEVGSLHSRLDKKEIRLGQLEADAAELRKNADVLVSTVADHETRLKGAENRIGAVEAQIKKVAVRVTSAHKTAGTAIELAGGQRYFIIDFATTGKKVESQIETLHKTMKKEGLVAVRIVGFADGTPPKKIKDPKEVLAINEELSLNRAARVVDGMEPPIITSATEVIGRGATGQFGDKKLNRCVLVVVEKAAPAPTTPATPSTPAPAPTGGGGLPPAPSPTPTPPPVPAVPPATIAPAPPAAPAPAAPPASLPPSVPQPAPFTSAPITPTPAAPTPPPGIPASSNP